jgi:hypothetical protein
MNRDFVEMLSALSAAGAEFLLVGAHALSVYGVPRSTGDLDLWVHATPENAARVWQALTSFGAPLAELSPDDFTQPETVFQFGIPPNRIDMLTTLSGVDFATAWKRRGTVRVEGIEVPLIGREDFVANKRATGRPKDLSDLALLEESERADRSRPS